VVFCWMCSPHPARQSGERSAGFNGASIKNKGQNPSERGKGRGQVCVRRTFFVPPERGLSLPFGLCRKAALDHERRLAACRASAPSLYVAEVYSPAFSSLKNNPMAIERTFSIIKPDATARNLTGAINAMIEGAGLRIIAQRRTRITREQAEAFYAVHRERPFFR